MSQAVDSTRARIARSTTEQRQAATRRVDMLRASQFEDEALIRPLAANADMLGLEVVREDPKYLAGDSHAAKQRLEATQLLLDQQERPLLSAAQQAGRALE
jgi:hypothetical protein